MFGRVEPTHAQQSGGGQGARSVANRLWREHLLCKQWSVPFANAVTCSFRSFPLGARGFSPNLFPTRFAAAPVVMTAYVPARTPTVSVGREVIQLEEVVVYGPPGPSGSWRIRWNELGRRHDTTARSREAAMRKAEAIAERLNVGTPTAHLRAKGKRLVAHYLDLRRRPARGTGSSERYRDDQTSYCDRFVLPVIAEVTLKDLRRWHFQRILDAAPTASVGEHLRRCVSAMVAAGVEEGLLLARQDVLRGIRWYRAEVPNVVEETGSYVDEADIPTAAHAHTLAQSASTQSGVWWRQPEILLVAYSGMRWGEHAALTRQGRSRPSSHPGRPSGHRDESATDAVPAQEPVPRTTMYPARTPLGVDLATMVTRRLRELQPDAPLFPSPRGRWSRRSNYRRNVFAPAALAAGWPSGPDRRLVWTFHSLRHVFATWALSQPGARIEDVSRLMGHSSVRITQDIYVRPDGDLFERFFDATR